MQIVTERLVVRAFTDADLAAFLDYQSHPRVRQYMPGAAMEPDKAEAFLARQGAMTGDERDTYHAFAVALRDSGRVIGDVGMYLPSGDERVGDLGFQFNPEFHGCGYATEAVAGLILHAFTVWNLDRITSACDALNVRSYRLMERVGMLPVETEGNQSRFYELTRKAHEGKLEAG